MAHQTQSIPWNVLADQFSYRFQPDEHDAITDLYSLDRPDEEMNLQNFIQAFKQTIEEQAETEFQKHPKYEPVGAEAVVLDDRVTAKITPIIRRTRRQNCEDWSAIRNRSSALERMYCSKDVVHASRKGGLPERHSGCVDCQCSLPIDDRKMEAFLHPYHESNIFLQNDFEYWLGCNTIKALILADEMETVLQICCHPKVCLVDWTERPGVDEWHQQLSFGQLCRSALASYVGLNVLYCYPQLWDKASGRTEDSDYRRTRAYAIMVTCVVGVANYSDIQSYAHQEFHGLSDEHCKAWIPPFESRPRDFPSAAGQLQDFLRLDELEAPRKSGSDVGRVRALLWRKGLPMELVLDIMEKANYKRHVGSLSVPFDPLHPENKNTLQKYLTYCWKLMVRCGVLARSLDRPIDWATDLRATIDVLFRSSAFSPPWDDL